MFQFGVQNGKSCRLKPFETAVKEYHAELMVFDLHLVTESFLRWKVQSGKHQHVLHPKWFHQLCNCSCSRAPLRDVVSIPFKNMNGRMKLSVRITILSKHQLCSVFYMGNHEKEPKMSRVSSQNSGNTEFHWRSSYTMCYAITVPSAIAWTPIW